MDLELTEEQQLLQKSVREFAESEVRPLAKEHDETGHFPRGLFKKAAELGLAGVPFPESEGEGLFYPAPRGVRESGQPRLPSERSGGRSAEGRSR